VVDLMGVDAFPAGLADSRCAASPTSTSCSANLRLQDHQAQQRRRNIVVSRRVILEAERATKREKLMKELEVGQVRKGVVKNITDLRRVHRPGRVDGLLHITDMSYGRVSHPSEMVKFGQELEVKILDIDWERERISLGLKQLQTYPWQTWRPSTRSARASRARSSASRTNGAFIELEPGIEGLVHISEMSWTRNVRHPSKLVSIGETIEAVVLKVDESEEKISLGMKQTEQDRGWSAAQVPGRHAHQRQGPQPHELGAFVEIEPGIDGLIHISDMSWTKRVQHPSEVVKKGDAVDVVILNIDADNKRISLGSSRPKRTRGSRSARSTRSAARSRATSCA